MACWKSIGLGGEANFGKRLTVLRAIDKFDRLGDEGVRALLGKGRKDESGDFTKGANSPTEQIDTSHRARIVGSQAPCDDADRSKHSTRVEHAGRLRAALQRLADTLIEKLVQSPEARCRLDELDESRSSCGRIRRSDLVDSSVVRGLEYYTGPVFEAELTAPIKDERGQPIRLGSVVSGGRYDGLVERFTGEKVPATGVSIGVSRLLFGLQRLGKYQDERHARPGRRAGARPRPHRRLPEDGAERCAPPASAPSFISASPA